MACRTPRAPPCTRYLGTKPFGWNQTPTAVESTSSSPTEW